MDIEIEVHIFPEVTLNVTLEGWTGLLDDTGYTPTVVVERRVTRPRDMDNAMRGPQSGFYLQYTKRFVSVACCL